MHRLYFHAFVHQNNCHKPKNKLGTPFSIYELSYVGYKYEVYKFFIATLEPEDFIVNRIKITAKTMKISFQNIKCN